MMSCVLITNIDEYGHEIYQHRIIFTPWGFSRKQIADDFQPVINKIINLKAKRIHLVMKPYLFGNRILYIGELLNTAFPGVEVEVKIYND
jgi:hypothetical protein